MDIRALILDMISRRTPDAIARDPRAQFGTRDRAYLGAEILPERLQEENVYEETAIRYRTVVANAGTRYSPVQIKGPQVLVGSFLVKLAEQDIGAEFTARDYDALLRLLRNGASMDAIVTLTRWLDVAINRALLDLNEVYRWQAIVDALVQARGNMGYSEDIAYSNPAGHRANAAGTYTGGASVDPWLDILAQRDLLVSKGYRVTRIVTSTPVISKIIANRWTQQRLSGIRITEAGALVGIGARPTEAQINAYLVENDLPPFTKYDATYNTQTGNAFFLKRDVIVMTAETGQEEEVRIENQDPEVLPNTLGYFGVGRPAGRPNPGRVIVMKAVPDEKPPRVEAQGWQTGLPVITQPEAIATIKNIT